MTTLKSYFIVQMEVIDPSRPIPGEPSEFNQLNLKASTE